MVFGNGYGGEEGGPVIEQTSSSPTHYEIMALARLLAAGLGVCLDGEEEEPYLLQVKNSLAEIKRIGSSRGKRPGVYSAGRTT